ncbi:Gfo/Idh/MocA family oxidoreductase [Hassallia byssoidea VB512170]|uniref:Gfo/Idh/MocA family oxidoreductase n=1 Tax=Hassallia byssoidea VB512170 TaxID=1304833 RepID=A0A846HLW2_9CYAN|nr:Gfo/Idh/MocA family oxidoreductase [Hassalia byssoidea]NEU76941.1 Gfo/Idh/MocA family oxidoreductase [Hassalia byssoidea VB512170]
MIKIAVIGVGRWGVHLLRNFLQHPDVSVAAVVDPNPERLAAVKQQFNLDNTVILTTQWHELKHLPGLQAVVIATPAITHYSLIADALRWGYHVLAEKPLTLDPTECQELCQLAEQLNLILMVDHTYLFHPVVERGQTVVQAGKLGDLRYGYASRTHLGPVRQDVDALWDLAIHDIAIFNNWLGQTPVKVQATGTVWLQRGMGEMGRQGDGETRRWGDKEMGRQGDGEKELSPRPSPLSPLSPCPPVPPSSPSSPSSPSFPNQGLADLVWVTLTYPDGFQAYIHLCWLNPDKQRRIVVVGSLGSLIFDEMSTEAPLTLLHGEFAVKQNQFIPVNQSREVLEVETSESLQRVCSNFVNCILENTPSMISSGWVGTELVQILTALTESLKENGKSVLIDKFVSR